MKTAKVFKQGNSQAVRLPKEFRLTEDEVEIRREGETIVLLPKSSTRWRHVRACLGKFKGELERNQPAQPDRRDW
ncbi:MAG: type II toxin-antitoxin system VapB family antitoxin [Thiobacillus sp.]|nr:type II toxin-antitoxin system VapB family antitoxin [Thiobacillus sp.]